MENIQHNYPLPNYPEYGKRTPWRLKYDEKILYQLPEDFIDKYICQIVDKIEELLRNSNYDRNSPTITLIVDEFFICFDPKVLDFLQLHRMELIYPLVREGILISLRRNWNQVEMTDVQPYLAVIFKVWTWGTSLEYFLQNRKPLKKFNNQKIIRRKLR